MSKLLCPYFLQIKSFVGALACPAAQFYKRVSVKFILSILWVL